MKRLAVSLVMCLAFVAFLAPSAFSDTITWTNSQYANGTGFGNVTNVLSLQVKGGGNGTEEGSVFYPPMSSISGDATNTSKTWTAAQLTGLGFTASNLGIVFNLSEPGNEGSASVTLNSFSLDFFTSSGGSIGSTHLVSDSSYIFPLAGILPVGGSGTGTSGWLMNYNAATSGFLATFFADGANVLGGTGSVSLASDGQDNFYLVRTDVPPPSVPEPTTILLLGSGLVGLAVYGRKAFKR